MNEKLELLINEVKKAVLGKDDVLKKVVIALLANGHILLEDLPGVGKTNLAVALTKAIQLDYQRVQLTSDVLPSDLLGYSVYDFETKEMTFKKGPLFTNIFLADEINRTSSKTQSALLQVMEEGMISVDGLTYPTVYCYCNTKSVWKCWNTNVTRFSVGSFYDAFIIRLS